MQIRFFLDARQKKELTKALKKSDCPHFRERILMLLLRNEGMTYQEISDFLGCSYRSVAYWCVHGDPDNLESLKDKRRQGNYRKATKAYIQLLMEVIKKAPNDLGYEFDRWTGERLANYLAQSTGIKLSVSQVRKILNQQKIRLPLGKVRSRAKAKIKPNTNNGVFAN